MWSSLVHTNWSGRSLTNGTATSKTLSSSISQILMVWLSLISMLLITLRISDTDVKRLMVDDGSGACIIHPWVLTQMRLKDKIVSCCITLTCFNNAVERTFVEITLPILAGGVTLETMFHVMNQYTTYNAIIGRSWIHAMRAILSSLYQAPYYIGNIQHPSRTRHCPRMLSYHQRLRVHPITKGNRCRSIAITKVGDRTWRTNRHHQGPWYRRSRWVNGKRPRSHPT